MCAGLGWRNHVGSDTDQILLQAVVKMLIITSSFCYNTAGLASSDKESARYLLQRKGGGNAVVIAVGGAPEALDAHPRTYNVLLAKKKGFIKLAMQHG